jgi:hypothetical protein
MAEGRAVFWELGLAEKEKDPTDPTGKGSKPSANARWTRMTPPSLATRKLVCLI